MAFRAALRSLPARPLATATATATSAFKSSAAFNPSTAFKSTPFTTPHRLFHATRPALVKVGDAIPNRAVLVEDSPGNKVNLAEELSASPGGKAVVIGVPAAFSGACSQTHVPGYMRHPKVKELLGAGGVVAVVSVNDAFVMKAWGEQLDPVKESGIRFLGDPTGEFTRALDLGFDASAIFGGMRGKRYALVVENGKVTAAHVEPDNTGTNVSLAEKVLG